MSTLIAVGGTGQWFLLEWLLARQGGMPVPAPAQVFLLDADWKPTPEGKDLASVLDRLIRKTPGVTLTQVKPADLGTVTRLEARQQVPQVVKAATTWYERRLDLQYGFFGCPRLTSVVVSLLRPTYPFLSPAFLGQVAKGDIVVCGSVVGGTGAGLMPYLLKHLRAGRPQEWHRRLTVIATLPWFNPPVGERVPTFAQTCANAAAGTDALQRVASALSAQAQAEAPAASTDVLLVGPPLASAEGLQIKAETDDATGAVSRGSCFPFLGLLVEALPDLLGAHDQHGQRHFRTATLAPQYVQAEGAAADRLVPLSTLIPLRAAHQAQEVADLPFEGGVSLAGLRIHRPDGFGKLLGMATVVAALNGTSRATEVLHGFTSALRGRAAKVLAAPSAVPTKWSPNAARARTISDIDAFGPSGAARQEWWAHFDPMHENQDGPVAAADELYRVLLSAARETLAKVGPGQSGLAELKQIRVARAPLLPGVATGTAPAGLIHALDSASVEAAQAELRRKAPEAIEDVDGRGYALFLGVAHALTTVAQRMAASPPPAASARERALVLWRASLHGLLRWHRISAEDAELMTRTEGKAAQWLLSYDDLTVGFFTDEAGLVPVAELTERYGKDDHSAKAGFEKLMEAVELVGASDDYDQLAAWAATKAPHAQAGWTAILRAGRPAPPPWHADDFSDGVRVTLTGVEGPLSVPVRLPGAVRTKIVGLGGRSVRKRQVAEVVMYEYFPAGNAGPSQLVLTTNAAGHVLGFDALAAQEAAETLSLGQT